MLGVRGADLQGKLLAWLQFVNAVCDDGVDSHSAANEGGQVILGFYPLRPVLLLLLLHVHHHLQGGTRA